MSIALSSGAVVIGGSAVTAYSVQISGSGGAGAQDTIDITGLEHTAVQVMTRPLLAAGAAAAKYSVTVEYFGTAVSTNANASVTLPVLGLKNGCTISSSVTTYQTNDAVRGSVTILVP